MKNDDDDRDEAPSVFSRGQKKASPDTAKAGTSKGNKVFQVSLVTGMTDKKPRHEAVALAALMKMFDAADVRADKNGAGITLGKFDAKAWKADPRPATKTGKKSGWLQDAFCVRSSGYLGDIDNKKKDGSMVDDPVTFDAARKLLDDLGISYALHTTYTSTPKWPRIRFVIPFATDLIGTPNEIGAQYKAIHDHFNAIFGGALDSRSSPAFFAYLPATPKLAHYQRRRISKRPLFDPFSAKLAAPSATTTTPAHDMPAEHELPKVAISKFRLPPPLRSLIEDGATSKDRSADLNTAILGLSKAGMNAAQIVSCLWSSQNKISEVVREPKRGFDWLCSDVRRVLEKQDAYRKARDKTLFGRYIYVEKQKRYYDTHTDEELDKDQMNDRYMKEFGDARVGGAHKYWQANFSDHNGTRVYDYTYAAGNPRITTFARKTCLNLWTKVEVEVAESATDAQIAPWLKLWQRLVPEKRLRQHFFDWQAHVAQFPGRKINHHPLMAGDHGIGKDTAFEPLLYSIGGGISGSKTDSVNDRQNISYITNEGLDQPWGYHLKAQVCCVEELREVYSGARKKLSNKFKPLLATPPPTLKIDAKYAHPFEIPNLVNWIFYSNSPDAISLDDKERRFYAYWTNAEPLTEAESDEIWRWYKQGGLKRCARWLLDRDVSHFNPKARAPRTTFHDTLAASGKTDVESALHALIDGRIGVFKKNLVSPEDAAVQINNLIANAYNDKSREPPAGLTKPIIAQQISTAFTAKHWRRLKRIDTTREGKRFTGTLFAHSSVYKQYAAMKPSEAFDEYVKKFKP